MRVDQRIMVVDEEAPIRILCTEGLSRAGFNVCAVSDAEGALAVIPNTMSTVGFLGLHMPGMNGVDPCRKIYQYWPMAIRYAVSGYASLYELNDCREAGFEDYFVKPVCIKDLVEAADKAFFEIERWKTSELRL